MLVVALLAATGSQWAVMQSVAWAQMITERIGSEGLTKAINQTFDGKHPCALCLKIEKSRKAEKHPELRTEFKRLEFAPQEILFSLYSPTAFSLLSTADSAAPSLLCPPPVPPPRSLQG